MSEPRPRTITLHTFGSVKGGVGKSTLAVVCAKLLAADNRVPVLVDCDLTGTSIADGLRLRSPKVATDADGSIDFHAAPSGEQAYHSVDETRRLRAQRRDAKWRDRAHPPPYFNDILEGRFVREQPIRVDVALWRHEREDRVWYLPSSSVYHDIEKSLAWYNDREPFDWARSFLWALDDLVSQREDLTDIVIDLPPGTWGFPHETMVIVATLLREEALPEGYPPWHDGATRFRANPFLVTSSDGNDLLPALEYIGRHHRGPLQSLRPLANRFTEGEDAVRERARVLLGPALSAVGLEQMIRAVPEVREMARLFKEGDVPLNDAVKTVKRVLRLMEDV